MNTNPMKEYITEVVDKNIAQGIRNFVETELKKIEENKSIQIEELKRKLPKEAERIAAEVAIDIQLWRKIDELSNELKITITTNHEHYTTTVSK